MPKGPGVLVVGESQELEWVVEQTGELPEWGTEIEAGDDRCVGGVPPNWQPRQPGNKLTLLAAD